MKKVLGQLTYANVMATAAIFIALGGVSYAAFKLPKNSVGTKQIKDNAISGAKIKAGAITGSKIAAGSIGSSSIDLKTLGTVPSASEANHATSAGTATSATTAGTANTAVNSNQLGGIPPQGFMSSTRFAFGSASTDPATPVPLFTLGGIEVTTAAAAGSAFKVRVRNVTGDHWEFGDPAENTVVVVNPNASGTFTIPKTRTTLIAGIDIDNTSKAISIQCGSDNGPNLLYCFGQASPKA